MPKKETCGRNWSEYNKSLVQRGNITLWIDEEVITSLPKYTKKRGRPTKYSTPLIKACLLIKNIYHLTFRQAQGFITSLYRIMKVDIDCPNYSTICRRQESVEINLTINPKYPVNIVVDSTGLKILGEGEWCSYKHGMKRQRTWRKVHLAINSDNLEIISCKLTKSREQDSDHLECLLSEVPGFINNVIADGAYDTFKCYESIYKRGGKAILPPMVTARLSSETVGHKKAASCGAIEQRDTAILMVRELGKDGWKKESGYYKRNLAETTMYRLKAILGDRLRARKIEYQELEVKIRCDILNRINKLCLAA